jgi:hypothetical protein
MTFSQATCLHASGSSFVHSQSGSHAKRSKPSPHAANDRFLHDVFAHDSPGGVWLKTVGAWIELRLRTLAFSNQGIAKSQDMQKWAQEAPEKQPKPP